MNEQRSRLADKVALVTGAGATGSGDFVGIGQAISILFARQGAKVLLVDREAKNAEITLATIREEGGDAAVFEGDVTSNADCEAMAKTAVETYGKLNVLLNNAGILIRKNIEETTEQDWDRIFAVNAKGVFLGTKAAIPAMREAGGGSIINISSTAGLVGSPNGSASYTATKGAVRLFTKSTAIQHAHEGIRCNSIHPGPIETDMIADTLNDPANMELRMQRLPLQRVGKPSEIAYPAIYLASDESSFVTGSEVVVDGGTTAA